LLAVLNGGLQGVTFLCVYARAEFFGVLWLACLAGSRAGLRRCGKEHNYQAELKKNLFSVAHIYISTNTDFWTLLQGLEARLLASLCLSVRLPVRPSLLKNSAPTESNFMTFYI
jgi:hypothetical protein